MDLYALLGLSRAATAVEIGRAYRRLSRRYHPGVNPGDRAAADLYRQIQEAYEVLVDADRRQEYDRRAGEDLSPPRPEASVAFQGFDFSAPAEGPMAATFSELFADVFQDAAREATAPTRGLDIQAEAHVAFRDAVRGGFVPLSVTRHDRCPTCLGDGAVARPPAVCAACAGAGSRRWARGHMVFTKVCESCGGSGRSAAEACRTCGGVGTSPRTEVVTIPIPAGIEDATRVSVPGHGHAGARGGPAGDLYVTLRVAPHPYFRRRGRDLHLDVPLAVHEAALGADIEVPTLDGTAAVHIPAGAAGGTTGGELRLKGLGVPPTGAGEAAEAGDLVLDLHIALPADLDDASKALLKEFGRLNGTSVRHAWRDA